MPTLGDDFRKRSAEQHEAAINLLESDTFAVDAKEQSMFVVGKVTANLLQVMGEVVDYLHGMDTLDAAAVERDRILEKTNGIRNAAAAGEWGEFDKLVRAFGGGTADRD